MPFGSTFTGARDYQAGDFIFGLADAVEKFKTAKSVGKAGLGDKVVTVKQLTNVIDGLDKFTDERFEQNYQYLKSVLEHPKYHSSVVSQRLGLSTKDKPGGEGSNEAFRRKSKGALNYLISQGQFLHFVLDGLKIPEVIAKVNHLTNQDKSPQPVSSGGPPKYRDVTGAELRWIFRHRNDPDTQQAVQFWIKDAPCDAPWDMPQYKQAWVKYGLQVSEKHGVDL